MRLSARELGAMHAILVPYVTGQPSKQYLVVSTQVSAIACGGLGVPFHLITLFCLRYKRNGRNIDNKTETHIPHQAMFGNWESDRPAAVDMPFAPPYHSVRNESGDQTITTHPALSEIQGVSAERKQVEHPTRATNTRRTHQLQYWL